MAVGIVVPVAVIMLVCAGWYFVRTRQKNSGRHSIDFNSNLGSERMWLFHGTCDDTVVKIVAQGFNRNFGFLEVNKNALTMYGKGVYYIPLCVRARARSLTVCFCISLRSREKIKGEVERWIPCNAEEVVRSSCRLSCRMRKYLTAQKFNRRPLRTR